MHHPLPFAELREQCCEANQSLYRLGIVDLTFGNVSVADRSSGVFAIKPSGVPYEELTPEQIPVLSLDAAIDPKRRLNIESLRVEGDLRPSSDTATHLNILREFHEVQAVVHTHSRYATAFAQAGMPIPCLGTTHADYFHGPVPVTRYLSGAEVTSHYEWETGKVIAETFGDQDPFAVPAVLLQGHAPFVWGPTPEKAVETAYALEVVAELAWRTLELNPHASPLPRHVLDKHFFRKHGKDAYYGQEG